jgi:membrane associated rhomboid family serine protease
MGSMMGSMSIWHWLILLVYLFVLGYPVTRILKRLGYSAWWVIIAFIPLANLIGLWFLAFMPRES